MLHYPISTVSAESVFAGYPCLPLSTLFHDKATLEYEGSYRFISLSLPQCLRT